MKRLPIVFLALMVLAGIFSISPTDAGATARTITCDGTLTLAEKQELNALPVNQITRAMLCDVEASDPWNLTGLDADLKSLITTPTVTRSWGGLTLESPLPVNDGLTWTTSLWWRTSRHVHTWRHENGLGMMLTQFKHTIRWSWNHSDVRDVTHWWELDANLPFVTCGAEPTYINHTANRNHATLFAMGNYGAVWPAGCGVEVAQLGGQHTVGRHGKIYLNYECVC
jgi:hypothetical protein